MRYFKFASHSHIGDMVICTGAIRNVCAICNDVKFITPEYCRDIYRHNPDMIERATTYAELGKITYGALADEQRGRWGNVVEGFTRSLCGMLGIPMVSVVTCVPVLHLTDAEMERAQCWRGYWLINANCQTCSMSKGYPQWQRVVDLLGWRFAQIGGREGRDLSPDLTGVLDMRGQTTLRDLMVMAYGCDGIISPPSCITSIGAAFGKPQICVNAGREPDALTDYPRVHHISRKCACGWGVDTGCIACRMGAGKTRSCMDYVEAGGRAWAKCQWETQPEEIAWLARELRASTVNYQ
jgi:hypothetical protein